MTEAIPLPLDVAMALIFATKAHGNQARKYTGEPYIVHPIEVMQILHSKGFNDEHRTVALLHDVLEDTTANPMAIEFYFGLDVLYHVQTLTDLKDPNKNRATRKAEQRERLSKACALVQNVKCADLISNARGIGRYDPEFYKVYVAEARALLDVMTNADRDLHYTARATLDSAGMWP